MQINPRGSGWGFFPSSFRKMIITKFSAHGCVSREKGPLCRSCTEVSILAFCIQECGRASGTWQSSHCSTHTLQWSPLTVAATATQRTCHRAVARGPPRSSRTPGSLLTCLSSRSLYALFLLIGLMFAATYFEGLFQMDKRGNLRPHNEPL